MLVRKIFLCDSFFTSKGGGAMPAASSGFSMAKDNDKRADDAKPDSQKNHPSDLLTGSVLFVIFLVFMTLWMMFRLP